MTAAEQKSDFEKDPLSRAGYGVLLWGSDENLHRYDTITVYEYLNHNSLGPNDGLVSYIITGWDNGFSLAGCQAIFKTNCTLDALAIWDVVQTVKLEYKNWHCHISYLTKLESDIDSWNLCWTLQIRLSILQQVYITTSSKPQEFLSIRMPQSNRASFKLQFSLKQTANKTGF